MATYYEILGVSRDATKAEISSAYRNKSKELSAGIAVDDPEALRKYEELSKAYEVFSDEEQRKAYDKTLD